MRVRLIDPIVFSPTIQLFSQGRDSVEPRSAPISFLFPYGEGCIPGVRPCPDFIAEEDDALGPSEKKTRYGTDSRRQSFRHPTGDDNYGDMEMRWRNFRPRIETGALEEEKSVVEKLREATAAEDLVSVPQQTHRLTSGIRCDSKTVARDRSLRTRSSYIIVVDAAGVEPATLRV
jgi:hypothetical protein